MPVVLSGYTDPVPSSTIVAVPYTLVPPLLTTFSWNVSAPSYTASLVTPRRTNSWPLAGTVTLPPA